MYLYNLTLNTASGIQVGKSTPRPAGPVFKYVYIHTQRFIHDMPLLVDAVSTFLNCG